MKQIIKNYVFDPSAKTIIFGDFGSLSLDRLLLITNVTSNTILYQFNSAAFGASVAGNIVTLNASTTGMNVGDKLQIIYDCAAGDPLYDSGGAQGTINGNTGSGSPDSGNPVKTGGVYRTSQPTFNDGQRADTQVDMHGNQLVTLATSLAGEDLTNNVLGVIQKPVMASTYSVSAAVSFGTTVSAAAKTIPGCIFGAYITNQNAALRYFQFFNTASAPGAGATPVWSFPIPAGTATNPGVLQLPNMFFGLNGYFMANGISWGVSTTRATFTAAVAADHDVNVQYV